MPPSQNRPQLSATDANTQHRLKFHEIRVTESHLRTAQRRRRQSNIAIVLGPVLIAILFELHWALEGHNSLSEAIYVPPPVKLLAAGGHLERKNQTLS
jgi:hypothetical protein